VSTFARKHLRLQGGRLAVIDATNVRPEARRQLIEPARRNHVSPVADEGPPVARGRGK
jgi:protein phosphatase